MIVDSSALVAILNDEPEAFAFNRTIFRSNGAAIAAPTYLETSMVMSGRSGPEALELLDMYITKSGLAILPFTPGHAKLAVQAFLRYGKGRHPAGLNFGDCIAYAVSKLEAMPLLYKGDDFALTDVETAVLIS
jgi:ribonuclease VapC